MPRHAIHANAAIDGTTQSAYKSIFTVGQQPDNIIQELLGIGRKTEDFLSAC